LVGILVLALLAGLLTETTLALGHRGGIVDDTLFRPAATPSPTHTPTATPKPTVSPPTSATPKPTPVATPAYKTATTNSWVRMRATKSLSGTVLYQLTAGTSVRLMPDSDASWQQVQYNGSTGYIWKAYLNY